MINRKEILKNITENLIKELSDLDFQKREWVQGRGAEIDCFDDIVCFFFSDIEPVLESPELYHLTKEQFEALKELHDRFDSYLDYSPETDAEVVEDPKWHKIVDLAKIVYEKLKNHT